MADVIDEFGPAFAELVLPTALIRVAAAFTILK
jgi:hypothetical protein